MPLLSVGFLTIAKASCAPFVIKYGFSSVPSPSKEVKSVTDVPSQISPLGLYLG
jgi:hypothetical protein